MTDVSGDDARRAIAAHDIANLQGRYMYWLEGHRYERVLECFARAPDVSAEIGESGVYVGRAKVEALFLHVLRPFFSLPGMMPVHMLTTPVVEVDAGGMRAAGMWQTIGCNSFPDGKGGLKAVWQQGTYDNLYIREEGAWRILRMRWLANFRTSFDRGWVDEPLMRLAPLDWSEMQPDHRPDLPGSEAFESYDPSSVRRQAPQPPEKS